MDGVVDNRDASAVQRLVKGIGNAIGRAIRIGVAFGKGELEVELRGDHLRHERAANQRPDHGLDALGRQAPRQLAGKGHPAHWPQEQRIKIKPQIAVVARLQDEMSGPDGEETEKLLFHKTANLGMLRHVPGIIRRLSGRLPDRRARAGPDGDADPR
ncbi:MAG TPA: hypothetical protein VK777_15085 [Reyranella sp.]|nr:hypothetical protein [Reyranella sp.]